MENTKQIQAPDLKPLRNKEPKEVAQFWFDYWNDFYPVDNLKLEYETTGFIEKLGGYASFTRNVTVFNEDMVKSSKWRYYSTARHEHVHHLLYKYGYVSNHTLQFYLVDSALDYAFHKSRNSDNGYLSVDFYDLHEDIIANDRINLKSLRLAAKRLSRYTSNIELLLSKAFFYAALIQQSTPTKRNYYRMARHDHVHNLLKNHGYDSSRTLQFYLVDSAIDYSLNKSRNANGEYMSVNFYDLHKDIVSNDRINLKSLRLAAKRLSRYTSNIELLLSKALFYSELIQQSTPHSIFNYQQKYIQEVEYREQQQSEIFNSWAKSEKEWKSSVKALEEEVDVGSSTIENLYKTNTILKFALMVSVAISIFLLVK